MSANYARPWTARWPPLATPLANVRDLGSGGEKAVADYRRQGIPDLLCHYHFLAAVGHRLLDDSHSTLRNELTRSRLRKRLRELLKATRPNPAGQLPAGVREQLPAMLLWLLEGSARKHPPYPFALPELDLYRSCGQFRAACPNPTRCASNAFCAKSG